MSDTSEAIGGRFVIQRRIGAGGMGVVYEAYDRVRQQTVAIKKLPEPDAGRLYRLKKEFRSLADVAHPNLVPLYELIADGNDWFFTMELVEGVDFLRFVRSPALIQPPSSDDSDDEPTISSSDTDPTLIVAEPYAPTLEKAGAEAPRGRDDRPEPRIIDDLHLPRSLDQRPSTSGARLPALRSSIRQLAEGIIALHNAGKLHCDLKPSNVLVRPNGHVVILDFGLVEELDPFREGSIAFAGTPVYMSPEQIEQTPISTASDWYAIGVMLYEALTGVLPFDGSLYSIMVQKRNEVLSTPRDLAADVPEDLSDLCMALMARLPEERPTGPEVLARLAGPVSAPAAPASSPRTPQRETVFVGRERELADLWRAYSVIRSGRVATAVVRGRSGLGKSALVHHFLSQVRQRDGDAVVLRGRCYQQESLPYKALDSLIDDLLHYTERLSALEMKAVVPGDIAMLARVFPVLEPLVTAKRRKKAVDVLDSQEVRRRAVAALREIFVRLAETHPVVLFIDDIQWGDRDSAAVLAALLQPPDAPPMLTVMAHRSDEADEPVFIDEIHRLRDRGALGEVVDIPILELTFDESRQLAALLGGPMPDDRLQSIAREADGSPMFVGEMIRFVTVIGGEHAPANLDDLIRMRVAAMPGAERQVLEMLAVAGQPLERSVLHATIGDEIGNAVLALRSEHMIRSRVIDAHEALDASHDRFREAVLASMTGADRRARHLKLAVALEDLGRRDPEMLATHYAAAGEAFKAAEHAAAAAANASAALAFDHAARLYRVALDLHPSIDNADQLRIDLADALTRAGRGFEAAPLYLEAADTADPNHALELRRRAAENLLSGGHVERGLRVMEQVLASVGMKLPSTPRRSVLAIIVQRVRLALRGSKYRERPVADIPAGLLMRVEVCWAAAIGLARVDNIRAAYFQALHLRLALEAGDPYRVARALAVEAGYSSVGGGRTRRRTDAIVRRAEGHARRLNHPHLIGLAALAQTFGSLFLGRFRAALEKANEADKEFRERCTGVSWEIDTTQSCSLCATYYLGELAQLAPRLNTLLREAEDRGDRYGGWNVAGRPSIVWLAMDDPDTAIRINRSVIDRWSSERFQSQHLFELLASAQIDLYLGRPAEAWQRVMKSWPAMIHSKILRVQFVYNEMLHLRARVGLAVVLSSGDRTVLRQVERDATTILRMGMDWARPLAQSIRAAVFAIHGNLDESRRHLTAAVRNFEKAEMQLYAAAARRRLGKLVGGSEGKSMVSEADRWLRGQLVKIPEKMVDVLMPGFR
ncbi:MAG TPA: protein kinase [Thermoanaerobaculia bacterium]|nr:protein kinase [Thermoanaerobaculia bacterium]